MKRRCEGTSASEKVPHGGSNSSSLSDAAASHCSVRTSGRRSPPPPRPTGQQAADTSGCFSLSPLNCSSGVVGEDLQYESRRESRHLLSKGEMLSPSSSCLFPQLSPRPSFLLPPASRCLLSLCPPLPSSVVLLPSSFARWRPGGGRARLA